MARTAILEAPTGAAIAVLGAMRAVALEHGGPGLTEMDRETIGSAATTSRPSTRPAGRARPTARPRRDGRSGCSP
jgi:hypothetical protein